MSDEVNKQSPTWVRVLLVVSLTVNILIVGWATGTMIRLDNTRDVRRGPPGGAADLIFALPQSHREALRQDLANSLGDRRNGASSPSQTHEQLQDILRAAPFDADALRAHLEHRQDRETQRLDAARESLIERLALMTDEERASYADRLMQRSARGSERGGRP